jgi:hypothetical protein
MSTDNSTQSAESVRPIEVVQCVCGKLKQRNFICDYCYSTEHNDGRMDP